MTNREYRPTLAQLRTFATVAKNKHFGTAAAKLGISQPSLSQALVALENGLGVQLIERSTRRVIVTAAGEKLLPYAIRTLEAAESFMAHAQGAAGTLTGAMTLGVIPTIAPYSLPDFLTNAQRQYPDLNLRIIEDRTEHLVEKLRNGHMDCALLALPIDATALTTLPLYTERFQLVVPADHPLAGRNDLTLQSLREVNLFLLDDGHCLRDQVVSLCKQIDLDVSAQPASATQAASLTTVMQLVAAGLGATMVPESAVGVECEHANVAIARFDPSVTASRDVGMVFRTSSSRAEEYAVLGDLFSQAFQAACKRQ